MSDPKDKQTDICIYKDPMEIKIKIYLFSFEKAYSSLYQVSGEGDEGVVQSRVKKGARKF